MYVAISSFPIQKQDWLHRSGAEPLITEHVQKMQSTSRDDISTPKKQGQIVSINKSIPNRIFVHLIKKLEQNIDNLVFGSEQSQLKYFNF